MAIFELLEQSPLTLFITLAILGLLVGSFLNVVILRLPVMMERQWKSQCLELNQNQAPDEKGAQQEPPVFNLSTPDSHCPQCHTPIKAWQNIPLISYLLLRGRCHSCQAHIPLRYPATELLTGLLTVILVWHFGYGIQLAAALVLTWALIALSIIDFDHQLLPDSIILPFLWLGLALSLSGVFTDPRSAIIGAIAGYLSLWLIYQGFKFFTGKEGMGYGDFKLFALFGAWMGWQALLPIALLSSVVGAVFGIMMIIFMGRDRSIPIPFGPYLACAGWGYLLWGEHFTLFAIS